MGKDLKLSNNTKYGTKRVSSLLLTKNKTFEQHLLDLRRIDRKKDAAVKTMLDSTEDLINWVNAKDSFDKAIEQVMAFLDTLEEEIPTDEYSVYAKKFEAILRDICEDEVSEEDIIYKNKVRIKKLIADPELAIYRRWFDFKYFRNEHHRIDDVEKIAKNASWGVEPLNELFTVISRYDMVPYGEVRDSKNNVITDLEELTSEQFCDQNVFKTFFEARFNGNRHHLFTFAKMMELKFKRTNQELGWLEHNSRFEKNMHIVEIEPELGLRILKTSSMFKDIFCKYRQIVDKLNAMQLHTKSINPWNRLRKLQFQEIEVSIEQAIKDARNSFSMFDEEYTDIYDQLIEEKWINWNLDPNKQVECSLSGVRGSNRFPIYLDWKGNTESVMSLIHEAGHSINAVLSKGSGIHSGIVSLISEIPGFVNEALLFCYYINKKYAKNPKGYYFTLLYNYLSRLQENICENVTYELACVGIENFFKQNKGYNFETLLGIYREACNMFGGLTPDEKKWISSKSIASTFDYGDFMTVFRAYDDYKTIMYFLGAVVGTSIGLDLYYYPDETVSKYMAFLKKGNTSDPVKALKELGYDITDPNTYTRLAEWLDKIVDIFDKCDFDDPTSLPEESEELAEKHSVDDYIYKILSGK